MESRTDASSSTILLAGGTPEAQEELRRALAGSGCRIVAAASAEEAKTLMAEQTGAFDVVLAHLKLPKGTGLEVLQAALEKDEETSVLVITAHGTIESAVEALKLGAYDYITKPIDFERLRQAVAKAMERRRLTKQVRELQQKAIGERYFPEIIGRSEAMKRVLTVVQQTADSDATILLCGESGTGKELVARSIHRLSSRRDNPFVPVNCGALPETLAESELFGYEKGAFTGAERRKVGRFEMADGGTIFLDEIAEMDLQSQVDLLRVLETLEFRRVGGTELVRVNVRVVAATNKNLSQLTAEGKFREDLFYRLNVIPIQIPPLRERLEDIPLLAEQFCSEFNRRYRRDVRFSPESLGAMASYPWPGNVRELKNLVERLVLTSPNGRVTPRALKRELSKSQSKDTLVIKLGSPLERVERELILKTLRFASGRREKAAKLLGISVRSLHYKLRRYESN